MRNTTFGLGNFSYSLHEPSNCPHCNNAMQVITHNRSEIDYTGVNFEKILTIVYKCAVPGCSKYFFVVYIAKRTQNAAGWYTAEPVFHYPEYCANPEITDLSNIAPNAMKIYAQAMIAKAHGLDELVGMGIRKAMDYLLYEFGSMFFPENKEFNENHKTTLNQRINKFIDNTLIKDLAEACTWLGNDFTHPIRRHVLPDTDLLEELMKALLYHVKMMSIAHSAKAALESDSGA